MPMAATIDVPRLLNNGQRVVLCGDPDAPEETDTGAAVTWERQTWDASTEWTPIEEVNDTLAAWQALDFTV